MGTINAESPLAPLSLSVEAKITPSFEIPPFVINVFDPFRI